MDSQARGTKSGFFNIFAGLLLILRPTVWKYGLEQSVQRDPVSRWRTWLVCSDQLRWWRLAGVGLYIPISFLFSNIGSVLCGVLPLGGLGHRFEITGLFMMLLPFIGAQFRSFMEKQEQKTGTLHQERRRRRLSRSWRKQPEFRERTRRTGCAAASPVDPEAGEMLIWSTRLRFPAIPGEEWIEPELSSNWFWRSRCGRRFWGWEEVQVDFLPGKPSNLSYQACNSLHRINPKRWSRKRRLFEKIIKS